jgi:hypothetical protein
VEYTAYIARFTRFYPMVEKIQRVIGPGRVQIEKIEL